MWWKTIDSQSMDALFVRNHSQEINKNKALEGDLNLMVDLNLQENL